MALRRGRSDDQVHVVTSAGRSRHEDIADRQRRYLIKMAIRTVCLVLAIVLYAMHVPFPILLGLIVASTILPWMSVVVANAGPDNRSQARPTPVSPHTGPALPPPREDRSR